MRLQATEEIRVFIDKGYSSTTPLEDTDVGYIPDDRRENLSWKGCYYTIKIGEVFIFDRSNNWDRSYFKLDNGAPFIIGTGDPETFINKYNITIL